MESGRKYWITLALRCLFVGAAVWLLTPRGGASMDGAQAGAVKKGFQYVQATAPPPSVTSVSPTSGPVSGGTQVTIVGQNFVNGCQASFGGTDAQTTFDDSTRLTVIAPGQNSPGSLDVRVTNPDGQADTLQNAFHATGKVAPPGPLGSSNDFTIGMFGFEYMPDTGNPNCGAASTPTVGGHNTSQLNVLAADGFNKVQNYNANFSNGNIGSVLKLVNANGLMMMVESKAFFVPTNAQTGTNDYWGGQGLNYLGNPTECDWKARPNYYSLFNNIYTKSPYKNALWGHEITEEASYSHCFNPSKFPSAQSYPYCSTTPGQSISAEVPPPNVLQAMNQFRSWRSPSQKLIVMEANHGKSIHNGTNDGEGVYNPEDYITGPLHMGAGADVFFEGSYTIFPWLSWAGQPYSNIRNNGPDDNWHYLGWTKSIDYALDNAPEVHKVINIQLDQYPSPRPDYINQYDSDVNTPNANWLWFQSYTSPIHGADGIWFYSLDFSWMQNEKPTGWGSMPNRYAGNNFPWAYQNFVGPLARELRYLVNNGFLTSDRSSILFTKTGHPDDFCIVPPAASYISPALLGHNNEDYGLRYTIRTNGQDAIMIVANPLPVNIAKVQFSFDQIANPIIANSVRVEALFETTADLKALASSPSTYKTTRGGRVTLKRDTAVSRPIGYVPGKKAFVDSFGPLDVHVYKFIRGNSKNSNPHWYHKALNWDAPPIASSDLVVDSSATHVFYRGADNRVYNFWWDQRGWWRNDALDYNAPPRAAGSLVLDQQATHLFFRGIDNRVYNFWWDGSIWHQDVLDATAPANCAGKLVLNATADHVYYIGTDDRVYNFWWDPAKSSPNKWRLDALDYNALPVALDNLVLDSKGDHLFFRGIDDRVYNFWWDGSIWHQDVLDATATANCAGDLVLNATADHVYYIGTDRRVYNFWWDLTKSGSNKWRLDALDYNALPVALDNLVLDSKGDHLFFRGIDNRIYNFWWDGSTWHEDALNWTAPANCAGDLVLNATADHVFYAGTDGHLYNFWWTGSMWQCDVLSLCEPPLGVHDIIMDHLGRLYCLANQRVFTYYWANK